MTLTPVPLSTTRGTEGSMTECEQCYRRGRRGRCRRWRSRSRRRFPQNGAERVAGLEPRVTLLRLSLPRGLSASTRHLSRPARRLVCCVDVSVRTVSAFSHSDALDHHGSRGSFPRAKSFTESLLRASNRRSNTTTLRRARPCGAIVRMCVCNA